MMPSHQMFVSPFRKLCLGFLSLFLALPCTAQATEADLVDLQLLTTAARIGPTPPSVQRSIGSQGGTISIRRLSVAIPAGALGQSYLVVLKSEVPDDYYPSDSSPYAFSLDLGGGANRLPLAVTVRGFGGDDRTVSISFADSMRDETGVISKNLPTILSGIVKSGDLVRQTAFRMAGGGG